MPKIGDETFLKFVHRVDNIYQFNSMGKANFKKIYRLWQVYINALRDEGERTCSRICTRKQITPILDRITALAEKHDYNALAFMLGKMDSEAFEAGMLNADHIASKAFYKVMLAIGKLENNVAYLNSIKKIPNRLKKVYGT